MKVLVTGYSGQLGYDVVRELEKRNIECRGITRDDIDMADVNAIDQYFKEHRPDAVIHCAAYTAVDKAEDDINACMLVNAAATAELATVCHKIGAKMIYVSSDYVFPGEGKQYYKTTDMPAPLGIYGISKHAAEGAISNVLDEYFIVRTSWVFGLHGKNNFVKTMLKLAENHTELKVVADQIGSPTYTADLAKLLCDMIMTDKYGIYHATNEGICSWAEFAAEIFRQSGKNMLIRPITTEEYPTRAVRPKNSRLSKEKLVQNGFSKLPVWRSALRRYFLEMQEEADGGKGKQK